MTIWAWYDGSVRDSGYPTMPVWNTTKEKANNEWYTCLWWNPVSWFNSWWIALDPTASLSHYLNLPISPCASVLAPKDRPLKTVPSSRTNHAFFFPRSPIFLPSNQNLNLLYHSIILTGNTRILNITFPKHLKFNCASLPHSSRCRVESLTLKTMRSVLIGGRYRCFAAIGQRSRRRPVFFSKLFGNFSCPRGLSIGFRDVNQIIKPNDLRNMTVDGKK